MNTVSRTVSTLLASSLVLLIAMGTAGATPIDGLETRFGSGGDQGAATSGMIDGLEVRYGTGQGSASTATPAAAHLDGLETRFAGLAPSETRVVAEGDADRAVGVGVLVTPGLVALAVVLASVLGYLAGTYRMRRLAHA